MTTTVRDICSTALQYVNAKAAGQPANGEDIVIARERLISMLDQLQIEPNAIMGLSKIGGTGYTPATGTQSFTIGPTGADITAPMPDRISEASYVSLGGTDYELGFADSLEEYNNLPVKNIQGYPYTCWYEPSSTGKGTLYVFPAANGCAFHLFASQEVVSGYTTMTLNTVLTLPRGMKNMLELNLARKLEIEFPCPAAATIRLDAANALRKWKRKNYTIPQIAHEFNTREYDINSGMYV